MHYIPNVIVSRIYIILQRLPPPTYIIIIIILQTVKVYTISMCQSGNWLHMNGIRGVLVAKTFGLMYIYSCPMYQLISLIFDHPKTYLSEEIYWITVSKSVIFGIHPTRLPRLCPQLGPKPMDSSQYGDGSEEGDDPLRRKTPCPAWRCLPGCDEKLSDVISKVEEWRGKRWEKSSGGGGHVRGWWKRWDWERRSRRLLRSLIGGDSNRLCSSLLPCCLFGCRRRLVGRLARGLFWPWVVFSEAHRGRMRFGRQSSGTSGRCWCPK